MGFNSVYRALQDVFPQIDSRILRAVAIEHSKDADIAVEVVLLEVIPRLSEQSLTVSSSNKTKIPLSISKDDGKTELEATMDPGDVALCHSELSTEAGSSSIDGSSAGATEDANSSDQPNSLIVLEPVSVGPLGISSFHDSNGETDTVCDGPPIILEKNGENGNINPDCVSSTLIFESVSSHNHDQECVKAGGENANAASLSKSVAIDAAISGSIQEETVVQLDITAPATNDTKPILSPASSSPKPTSEKDAFAIAIVNTEDESVTSSMLARSDQNCSIELLNDIIEDARNNKKTLVSAMDSVVNLMKEVEFKEKAVGQAKEDAARGCSDILLKVDELKQALQRAKEANDMHGGEVYAEKAILATELKELQLRLFNLSDERNRSLGILDEIRNALEIRLATALKEIEEAEEEKLEKEQSAREALAYQESQMEKVVEESKKLKLEAEENSKLQEFLMDRGRAIDILQGEISVKCQDVKLLKEKFDKRVPLSRSLSSSQTSSSSFRSTSTRSEPEPETYGTPKKRPELGDSYGFVENNSRSGFTRSPKSLIETVYSVDDCFPSGDNEHIDERKMVIDDGWELFEKSELSLGS